MTAFAGDEEAEVEVRHAAHGAGMPTIYDVARLAGVSIATVSRVLNDRGNPRPETRDRVRQAVTELGFVPNGAARALSVRLKAIAGVVVRRPSGPHVAGGWQPPGVWGATGVLGVDAFADEAETLQFQDMLNRGIERAAQRRDFDLLVRSVGIADRDVSMRVLALARKSDGLILHDQVLDPDQLAWLSRLVPVVTVAATPTPTTVNVSSDNRAGMRALARHLLYDHGYRSFGYLAGYEGSPDSQARLEALSAETSAAGAALVSGPRWRGNYCAAGAAVVTEALLAAGTPLPRVIVSANDQTALGVLYVLRRSGVSVPDEVAVTGFDDIPLARHTEPRLTTVKQPVAEIGEIAFEALYGMIGRRQPPERDIVLPTRLVCRESCGCPSGTGVAKAAEGADPGCA